MDVVRPEHTQVLVLTRHGYGKRTPLEEYRTQGRYGNGIRTIARNEKTGPVVAVRSITEEDGIVVLTKQGLVLRTSLTEIREAGRNTQGVRVIRIAKDDEVVGMALLNGEDEIIPNGHLDGSENGAVAADDAEVIAEVGDAEVDEE
jgi:DNA gyrase subunit A